MRSKPVFLRLVGSVLGLSVLGACSRDARLAGQQVRQDVTVEVKTLYGVTLDKDATPEQVAFVALRAIRDDFQAQTADEREAALDKQFDVCAPNVIQLRNRSGMDPADFLHNVVYRWTPTVSHYVDDFETDWEKAELRFRRRGVVARTGENAVEESQVLLEVADPSGDPNASAVLIAYLSKDAGFWRATHFGFAKNARSFRRPRTVTDAPAATQPGGN